VVDGGAGKPDWGVKEGLSQTSVMNRCVQNNSGSYRKVFQYNNEKKKEIKEFSMSTDQ